jgi:hypothetical protein
MNDEMEGNDLVYSKFSNWGKARKLLQISRIWSDRPPNTSVKHFLYPAVQDFSNGDNGNDYGGDEYSNKIPKWIFG